MTLEEYGDIMKAYNDILSYSMSIPNGLLTKRVIERQMDFISKCYPGRPSFTLKASWFIQEGRMIEMDKVIQMHPYDFCIAFANLSKDYDKALDYLKKYVHESIDRKL